MRRPLIPPTALMRLLPASLLPLVAVMLLLQPGVRAQTALTNGVEVEVDLPAADELNTIFNGKQGYTIFVPPGAKSLFIEFLTEPNSKFEILTRNGRDIGIGPGGFPTTGNKAADFRTRSDNLGRARMLITPGDHPPLAAGVYFIGFITKADFQKIEGELTVIVGGGPIEELFTVVGSNFDADAEGWTRNDAPSPLPGTNVGHVNGKFSFHAERGNPGGFIRVGSIAGSPSEFFVAPEKFHLDLLEYNDARIQFDLARITGDRAPNFNVEVRVFGPGGAWRWIGPAPPKIPTDFNFFTQEVDPVWRTYTARIRMDEWNRFAGEGFYVDTFSKVERIEVRAGFVISSDSAGLDNFQIVARGVAPPKPVLPTVSSFSAGMDRWERNFPEDLRAPATATVGSEDSRLFWVGAGGNSDGHIRLAGVAEEGAPAKALRRAARAGSPGTDAFVAPLEYRGIYTDLSSPRFEFDYKHNSLSGASLPVRIRIFGADSIREWRGAVPIKLWAHQLAPLEEELWELVSGAASFDEMLANIVRIEVSAEQAEGEEGNSLDNFALLTADSPPLPLDLHVDPESMNFSGAATAPDPKAQTFQITSSGATLAFEAAVEGGIAERVTLSQSEGLAPAELSVAIDTKGLGEGTFSFTIVVSARGATVIPATITATLTMGPQPVPTPEISEGGVVHLATYEGRVAPGQIVVIFGVKLGGPPEGMLTSFGGIQGDMLPTEVNGVRVLVYERFGALIAEAPLIYLSDKQINFQIPFEVDGRASVRVSVSNQGAEGPGEPVQIVPNAPGVFTFQGDRAVATNADGTLNAADNPHPRLQQMTVFMTGQGRVLPEWASGRAASVFPLIRAPAPARVFIGGVRAEIKFLGLAPGMVGVLQLNVIPKFQTPTGDQPLVVDIGGFVSNTTRVEIR